MSSQANKNSQGLTVYPKNTEFFVEGDKYIISNLPIQKGDIIYDRLDDTFAVVYSVGINSAILFFPLGPVVQISNLYKLVPKVDYIEVDKAMYMIARSMIVYELATDEERMEALNTIIKYRSKNP